LPEWRNLVCGVMIVILPTSLMAQDSGRAMLHSDGGAWLNGNPAPSSSAIFPQDLIQTQKGNRAKIDADGSTVTVQPDTIVQFEGDELVLDHGGLQVNTSRGMKVRVNCMTVIPLTPEWTRYDVIDVDGKMRVVVYQNDVKIHYQGAGARRSKQAGISDVTVHQSEQVTREERCGAAAKPAEVIDAEGAILNSPWAKGAGIAAIGIPIGWALCGGDNPVSPSKP
jgi:ferric-dicitrate binding protein FerR (iron transport regulator)